MQTKMRDLFHIDPLGFAMPGPRLNERMRSIIERRALAKISRARIAGLVGTCVVLSATLLITTLTRAQVDATEDWEKAAGGKMSFEVASVKPHVYPEPNMWIVLMSGFEKEQPSGLLRGTNGLDGYIRFAYKLDTTQQRAVRAQLPPWAKNASFDIDARTPNGGATSDQRRLMTQSLLADRFKLAAHFETKDGPAWALVLAKEGKLGSEMRTFPDGFPCSEPQPVATPAGRGGSAAIVPTVDDGRLPASCGNLQFVPTNETGLLHRAGRNVSMDDLLEWIRQSGDLDRPLVDRTGLNGAFDVSVKFRLEVPPGPDAADVNKTMFLQAVSDQLGLKLESITGPVHSLVIDHIEQPTPN